MKKIIILLLLLPVLALAQPGLTISTPSGNVALPDTLNGVDSTMVYVFWGSIKGYFGFIQEMDSVSSYFCDSISTTFYPRIWSDRNSPVETDNKPCETLWSEGLTAQLAGGTDKGTAINNWQPVADTPRLLSNQTWWDNIPVVGVVAKIKNCGIEDTCAVTKFMPIVQ